MKEPTKQSNLFQCLECKTDDLEREAFLEHITTVHGFIKGTQCIRSLVQALDGSDFYSNVFELSIPINGKNIKATQCSSGPRHASDLMNFEA